MSNAATPENPQDPSLATPSRRIDQLLAHYGESHTHPINEMIHYIAIPLIVFSLIGLLHSIHSNLSLIVIGASVMYYARLSNIFMIAMTVSAAVMLYIAGLMGTALLPISIGLFVVSWIFQFIGHRIEGKKPSFLEDLQYLLIGPLFVLSKLFLKLGIKW